MRNKAVANEMLLCGSIKGIILGTINATATLIKSVYIVMSAPSPPNFCVTTEADVAVGHIVLLEAKHETCMDAKHVHLSYRTREIALKK